MEPVKLLERAATTAVHAVRHPISSAAYAAGIARGLAGAAIHGVRVRGEEATTAPDRSVPAQSKSEPAVPEPQRVPKPVPPVAPEQITVIEPEPPHESFATEPKATSRTSEHGGHGDDAEIDQWAAEVADAPDIDIETPVGTTGAGVADNPDTAEADLQQPGTEPLLDPATAKAVRSESEMLRKDAERNPE